DVGVEREDPLARDLRLRPPDVARAVEHLALEVRGVDHVEVDDPERADARRRQVLRERTAEPPGADQQHARGEQRLLRLGAELGQREMALVALVLVRAERRGGIEAHGWKLPDGAGRHEGAAGWRTHDGRRAGAPSHDAGAECKRALREARGGPARTCAGGAAAYSSSPGSSFGGITVTL